MRTGEVRGQRGRRPGKRLLGSRSEVHDSPMPRDFLQPWAELLTLYSFRFRDPLTGKWVRARYFAECRDIAARYAEWEITGASEIRARAGAAFSPWKSLVVAEKRE